GASRVIHRPRVVWPRASFSFSVKWAGWDVCWGKLFLVGLLGLFVHLQIELRHFQIEVQLVHGLAATIDQRLRVDHLNGLRHQPAIPAAVLHPDKGALLQVVQLEGLAGPEHLDIGWKVESNLSPFLALRKLAPDGNLPVLDGNFLDPSQNRPAVGPSRLPAKDTDRGNN